MELHQTNPHIRVAKRFYDPSLYQGGCTHKGRIYSLEGFTDNVNNPAAIRIILPDEKRQERCFMLKDYAIDIEPELIDFMGDVCYFADCCGNLHIVEF